jgi:hypothetical protein
METGLMARMKQLLDLFAFSGAVAGDCRDLSVHQLPADVRKWRHRLVGRTVAGFDERLRWLSHQHSRRNLRVLEVSQLVGDDAGAAVL